MRIAYFAFPSCFQTPGGGEILLLKTKEALEHKGVEIKLFNQWEDKLKDFDILHVFGSERYCLGLVRTARAFGVKIALSPVFWSTMQRALYEYGSISKKAEKVLKHMAKVICPVFPSDKRKMHLMADVILPNSIQEADQVARLFNIGKEKMHVVYLGADERFSQADKNEFFKKYNLNNFILSVGRIEPRKNQLNLIKALKGSGRQLVFIGDPVADYQSYYQECLRLADKNTLFIKHLPHDSSLLSSAYAGCGLFVLQGWFETPGLAALEAGLAGARLAVTEGGSTREYFKDYVEYLNPASPESIRAAVNRALSGEGGKGLSSHIRDNFLWPHVAEENIKAYERMLK